MNTDLDTRKIANRRTVHFATLDDILADAERVAASPRLCTLGNWSAGQIFQHMAVIFDKSIDGFTFNLPAPLRFFAGLLLKRRFLSQPMKPGFRLPARAAQELVPPPISTEEGLQNLRRAIARLQSEERRALHAIFGTLTRAEYDRLHCRHAEMHFSFLLPEG